MFSMAYNPDYPPAFLKSKTPVSYLNELCSKSGSDPNYEEIDHDDRVKDSSFSCRCSVENKAVIGYGNSKKLAKHDSALRMIFQLDQKLLSAQYPSKSSFLGQNNPSFSKTGASGDFHMGGGASGENVIGLVQEFSQKRGWGLPSYEFQNGASGSICIANIRDYSTKVCASTKKDAKRLAAESLLQQLTGGAGIEKDLSRGSSDYARPINNKPVDYRTLQGDPVVNKQMKSIVQPLFHENNLSNEKVMNNLVKSAESLSFSGNTTGVKQELTTWGSHKNGNGSEIPVVTQDARDTLGKFYSGLSDSCHGGQSVYHKLHHLFTLREGATEDYVSFIRQLSKEHCFQVTFLTLPDKLSNGDYQCLLQLTTLPVLVCYGLGSTAEEADQFAACCALRYLYIMTQPAFSLTTHAAPH